MNTARVIEERKTNYVIGDGASLYTATVRGSFFEHGNFPKVGDYVSYSKTADSKAVIDNIQERQSVIARKSPETGAEQIIVTNVDLICIVMGLDGDFNLNRLERYLLLAQQSKINALVVLNKSDQVDKEKYYKKVQERIGDIPICVVSALTGDNMSSLFQYITPGTTVVLLGSSGAGKSTITNWLMKDRKQDVAEVRSDDSRGRHTTTTRQLFTLPNGAYLIDTPGMRELGLVEGNEEDENEIFRKIDELSGGCRYSDCDHEKSDGCAIVQAILNGNILEEQFNNYKKIQRERHFEESKYDKEASWQYKQEQKNLHKGYREIQKRNRSKRNFD